MRGIILMSLLTVCMQASAQSLTVTTDVTGVGSMQAVKANDAWHATEGATVSFTLTFTPPQLDEDQRNLQITKVTCSYNGESKEGELKNENTFVYNVNAPSAKQKASCELEYSYEQITGYSQEGDIQVPIWTPITGEKITQESEAIQIWATPSATFTDTNIKYLTENREFKIDTYEGGNNEGWRFIWNGNETTSPTYTEQKPNSVPVLTRTTLSIVNYAPGEGNVVWYASNEYIVSTYFYNEVVAEINHKPDSTDYYKSTNTEKFSVNLSGGGNKWTINWTGGSNPQSNTFDIQPGESVPSENCEYAPYPNDVTENLKERVIKVTIKNTDDAGHVFKDSTITFPSINVYKAMSHGTGRKGMKVYSGEDVTFEVTNVSGGYGDTTGDENNGWSYSWSKSVGSLVECNEQKITDKPTCNEKQEITYTLTAINRHNGNYWDSFTENYTATVYPIPSIEVADTIKFTDAKNNNQTDIRSKILSYPDTKGSFNEYHMIEGDKITIHCNTINGADGWDYTISLDNNTLNNKDMKWDAKKGTYPYTIHASNGKGIVENPYECEISGQFVVYEKPEFVTTKTKIHTFPGKSATFHAPVTGGDTTQSDTSGWTFDCGDGNTKDYIDITAGSAQADPQIYNFHAINKCEGYTRFDNTQSFELHVWPTPEVKELTIKLRDKDINTVKSIKYFDRKETTDKNVAIECYDGDILDIAYSIEGGYAAKDGSWTYQGTSETTKAIPYTKDDGYTAKYNGADNYVASCKDQESKTTQFTLIFKNIPIELKTDEEAIPANEWLDNTYTVTVKTWHKPSINIDQNTDSASTVKWKDIYDLNKADNNKRIDVYAGGKSSNNVAFKVPHSYGNTASGGWKYSWMKDDAEVATDENAWTFTPTTTGTGDNENIKLSVKITNKIDDNYGLDTTLTYPVRIWKKAVFANDYTFVDNNKSAQTITKGIRENNQCAYSVSTTTNGYTTGSPYTYVWTLGSGETKSGTSFTSDAQTLTGEQMASKDLTDRLVLSNNGPYGHVWDKKIITKSYRDYHKPGTPESITKKGKFTTGTLAISMPKTLSDDELKSYKYQLVFGYVDDSGNDHDLSGVVEQGGSGDVRWYQVPQTARGYSNYYVYAQWNYTDGAKVTSGKRYMNPVSGNTLHDEWDGSDFTNVNLSTRAYIIGSEEAVTKVESLSEDTDMNDNSEVPLRIYTLNGQIVDSSIKPTSGIYIVETMANGKKVTKKMIVK